MILNLKWKTCGYRIESFQFHCLFLPPPDPNVGSWQTIWYISLCMQQQIRSNSCGECVLFFAPHFAFEPTAFCFDQFMNFCGECFRKWDSFFSHFHLPPHWWLWYHKKSNQLFLFPNTNSYVQRLASLCVWSSVYWTHSEPFSWRIIWKPQKIYLIVIPWFSPGYFVVFRSSVFDTCCSHGHAFSSSSTVQWFNSINLSERTPRRIRSLFFSPFSVYRPMEIIWRDSFKSLGELFEVMWCAYEAFRYQVRRQMLSLWSSKER